MSTTTTTRTKREKLPFPDLLAKNHPLFWLAVYLREHTKTAELDALYVQGFDKYGKHRKERAHALQSAIFFQEREENHYLGLVIDKGLLLLAWPGTTALAALQGGAA